MDCHDVRRSLGALADGEPSPVPREAVAAHVSGCAACARAAKAIEVEKAWFSAMPRPAAPDDLVEKVRRRLATPAARLLAARPLLRAAALAASILLLLTLGAAIVLDRRPPVTSSLTADRAVERLLADIARDRIPLIGGEEDR